MNNVERDNTNVCRNYISSSASLRTPRFTLDEDYRQDLAEPALLIDSVYNREHRFLMKRSPSSRDDRYFKIVDEVSKGKHRDVAHKQVEFCSVFEAIVGESCDFLPKRQDSSYNTTRKHTCVQNNRVDSTVANDR